MAKLWENKWKPGTKKGLGMKAGCEFTSDSIVGMWSRHTKFENRNGAHYETATRQFSYLRST